jgi:beta-phosphoglucomutase family hydrolase
MMHSPLAALFDMDGTLVDNLAYHVVAWEAFCQRHDLPFSLDAYYRQLNGRNSRDTLHLLFGRPLTDAEVYDFTEEKEELYRQLYRPHLKPVAGCVELLRNLKAHGVKLAVATSAPLSNVEFTLDGAGLASFFEVVVYGAMVRRGKPDPEIYRITAEKLGVEPTRCVVFEDALLGVESARRAGMTVVGLTTSHSAEELAPGTALQAADFTGMTFETVQYLIGQKVVA